MSKEEDLVQAHPEGEVEIAGDQPAETVTSLDTFAGKVHVKWAPEAAVSSLGRWWPRFLRRRSIRIVRTTANRDRKFAELQP